MKNMWNYAALHFAVFSWGAAGITAKLMTLSPAGIVVYRSVIALAILIVFNQVTRAVQGISNRDRLYLMATGAMIGLHWWGFFAAIKVSTVSIALVCISSAPIFVAIFQPLVERTRIRKSQIVLGLLSVIGIAMMFKFESQYKLGIMIGLAAGAIDAVYSIMTSRTRDGIPSSYMTQMHMGGAALIVLVLYLAAEKNLDWLMLQSTADYAGIMFLGVICSAVAMSLYVLSIRKLSAFTATLSLNLEAVYGIGLALLIFGESEYMSSGFYAGASLLIGCVVVDGLLKWREDNLAGAAA